MVHLLAVDGNSMAHRAWHAIRESDDATGAFVLGGMVTLMASVWHHGPFDAVFVAFDDEVNARKEWHPTYKADRHTDDDLRARLRALPAHLAAAGIATAVEPGIEADDLLAAVTVEATRRGWRTDVLSGDRDLLPLVDNHVRVLRPRATMGDLLAYDPGLVRSEYGVEPAAYRHLAALRGDPSDGLPGVDGIGAKTAARLLADHGTLDELYANLCYLSPRDERALRSGRTLAMANLEVMTPIEVAVDLDAVGPLDVERTRTVLAGLDQERAGRRLAHHLTLATLDSVPPPDSRVPVPRDDDVPWPDHEPGRSFDDERPIDDAPAGHAPAGHAPTGHDVATDGDAAQPLVATPDRGEQPALFPV